VTPIATASSPLDITLTENARKYLKNAKAKRTVKAYRSDLAHFAAFCPTMRTIASKTILRLNDSGVAKNVRQFGYRKTSVFNFFRSTEGDGQNL
jgi:site-specific recombinase XerD